jgi:hypothetical protein
MTPPPSNEEDITSTANTITERGSSAENLTNHMEAIRQKMVEPTDDQHAHTIEIQLQTGADTVGNLTESDAQMKKDTAGRKILLKDVVKPIQDEAQQAEPNEIPVNTISLDIDGLEDWLPDLIR